VLEAGGPRQAQQLKVLELEGHFVVQSVGALGHFVSQSVGAVGHFVALKCRGCRGILWFKVSELGAFCGSKCPGCWGILWFKVSGLLGHFVVQSVGAVGAFCGSKCRGFHPFWDSFA
jgi:hypothetical protein